MKARKFGLVEERTLNGYLFKMFDEYDGFLVEVWLDGELINEEILTCRTINCVLTDDELLDCVP